MKHIEKLFKLIKYSVATKLYLRKWRRTIRQGDKVCIAKIHEVEVRIIEGKEVTIWDSMIREYETYPLSDIYPLVK